MTNQAQWVWGDSTPDTPNQYVEWRHTFRVGSVRRGLRLRVSADTNFVAWCNGGFLGAGQYSDWPDRKTYTELAVNPGLLSADNVLCILVQYCGVNTYGYVKGEPRLWYSLDDDQGTIIQSGVDSRCRTSPAYRHGVTARRSNQLGFVFEYDAAGDDGWRSAGYVPSDPWRRPQVKSGPQPGKRPIPPLMVGEAVAGTILAQGVLRRESAAGSVAEQMQSDLLSARRTYEVFHSPPPPDEVLALPAVVRKEAFSHDGVYVVIDLGRELCGYIHLEVSAEAGTVVDVAVGEHLADLRVRAAVRGRHFASRYVCGAGNQTFTHWIDRYAGRYLQVHVTNCPGEIQLHRAGLIPADYPIVSRGSFQCSDSMIDKIIEVGNRTVHLCMHEHYEDCPWREQAIYAADAHNQALTGYYAFGEYDFPRASWELLRHGLRPDGWLEMCAPARINLTIPFLTLVWVRNLGLYLDYSGDMTLIADCLGRVHAILDGLISNLVDDLLPCHTGKEVWQFYDWVHGLDGQDASRQMQRGLSGTRFDAPLNLFLVMAMQTAARLSRGSGDERAARRYEAASQRVSAAIHRSFWSGRDQAYRTYLGEDIPCDPHFAEETQALAILTGACSGQAARTLCARLADENNGLVKSSLSQSYYKYEAILTSRPELATRVFDQVRSRWGGMLMAGATSFWETEQGQSDFMHGGSLCHGWSGIPTYFAYAYLLGVKPIGRGFSTFSFHPLSAGHDRAEGSIPTPHGTIDVKWHWRDGLMRGEVCHPRSTSLVLSDAVRGEDWSIQTK